MTAAAAAAAAVKSEIKTVIQTENEYTVLNRALYIVSRFGFSHIKCAPNFEINVVWR